MTLFVAPLSVPSLDFPTRLGPLTPRRRPRRLARVPLATAAPASTSTSTTTPPVGSSPARSGGGPRGPLAPREDFPILEQQIEGRDLVYLDSAATAQKPRAVLRALRDYYERDNANVHRGAHALSARATASFEAARGRVRALVGAARREEVVFTRNATEAVNLVAYAWGLDRLRPGDEIVASVMEHHANLVPWQIVASMTGAKVRVVGLTEDQEYDLEGLKKILEGGRVKLVACSHVSNVLGCLNPVREIIRLAHEAGAIVLVDACQSVPHMEVDVQELDCEFLVASGHKMMGPTGVGFLYGKEAVLESMPPYMGGGEMIADVFLDHSTWAELPHKFEAGTPAIGEAIGLGAAVDYITNLGMNNIHEYEKDIGAYMYKRLNEFEEVTVYGPKSNRGALCAFNVRNAHASDIATMLDLEGVAVRSGHHCAQPLHRYLGIESSARASAYVYNTKDEVDVFIDALVEAVDLLGAKLTRKPNA